MNSKSAYLLTFNAWNDSVFLCTRDRVSEGRLSKDLFNLGKAGANQKMEAMSSVLVNSIGVK